jgi:uncharacterized radical SAM superfamily Fe-S cluster-containing enzyme
MDSISVLCKTESICPVCLKRIPAEKIKYGDKVYIEKYCSEHGSFKTLVWSGEPAVESWVREKIPAFPEKASTEVDKGCPFDCGLCEEHRQHTCTALIEVTQRCNLKCSFCFASSGSHNEDKDISIEEIEFLYKSILDTGSTCSIQLSGGEPTLRDDLPEIIKLGHDLGFKFIQVNTNGIRIAKDKSYVKRLSEAGLNSIFLQFDGTDELVYIKLRGQELLEYKKEAIENCRKYNIAVILVPTLVRDINFSNVGSIIDFAMERIPVVRGIHLQPVSYFGRFESQPDNLERITIPEVIRNIEEQTEGRIKKENFKPSCCENSFCSFHGNFIYKGEGQLMPVTSNKESCCSETQRADVGAEKTKNFTARNWSSAKLKNNIVKLNEKKQSTWDDILYKIVNFSFTISGMAFQDAWNFDIERVKECCIHVVSPQGKLIPFCAYNLTDCNGSYIYRRFE